MDNTDPSMSEVEEEKKERKEEEEEDDGLCVTEKDLKERNYDTDAKVDPLEGLMVVCSIGYEKLMRKERANKEKEHTILEDGKLAKLRREKALKKPVDFYSFEFKKKEKSLGENQKLLGSAIKSYRRIQVGFSQTCEVKEAMSDDPVRQDVFTTRKMTFTSMGLHPCSMESNKKNGIRSGVFTTRKLTFSSSMGLNSCSMESNERNGLSVNDEESKEGFYLRKDNMFKRSYAQGKPKGTKSNKRFKKDMPEFDSPELPQEVKEKIASMNGEKVKLVIDKNLYKTDLEAGNCRLSIPHKQVITKDFLEGHEANDLRDGKALNVKILEPSLEMVTDMTLKKWDMKKKDGKLSSSTYVFITRNWIELRKRNRLNVQDRIQVWSFRVGEDLYFAIVKVGERKEQKNSSNGSNTSASTESQTGVLVEHGSNGSNSSRNIESTGGINSGGSGNGVGSLASPSPREGYEDGVNSQNGREDPPCSDGQLEHA